MTPETIEQIWKECEAEANEKYPPHLSPDDVIGDHFMLLRIAVARNLYSERLKAEELIEAGEQMRDRISKGLYGLSSMNMVQEWDKAVNAYRTNTSEHGND